MRHSFSSAFAFVCLLALSSGCHGGGGSTLPTRTEKRLYASLPGIDFTRISVLRVRGSDGRVYSIASSDLQAAADGRLMLDIPVTIDMGTLVYVLDDGTEGSFEFDDDDLDEDEDGIVDALDEDDDGDGVGDGQDDDDDGDGVPDDQDDDDGDQDDGDEDTDGDGVSDAMDDDDDGDGVSDAMDGDDDGDGVSDAMDEDDDGYGEDGDAPTSGDDEPGDDEP